MLKGGGALNPDGLSLDLAFALDRSFTTDPAAAGNALITSRRGPAAKFSRGSGATQVNAAGLIEYAPENLLINSNSLNNWASNQVGVSASSVATPTGSLDAWKVTEDGSLAVHNVTQATSPVSGAVHTVSIWLKSAENGFAFFGVNGGGFPTTFVSVDLESGAVTTGVGSPVDAASTAFPNGWFRVSFSVTATSSLTTAVDLRLSRDGIWANRSYLGNGVNGIYAYGAQLERASTARTYYPTTSSAFYGPRFDYDPATLASKGLLIEEPRTNLVERSEAFNDAYWTKAAVIVTAPVVTADQVNSPSGVQSADRIVFPAVAGTNAYSLVFKDFSQAAGVSTAQSIYLRGLVGGEKIWIMWTPNGTTYVRKECVLTTSWQRFDLNYTSLSGLNYFQFGVDLRDASQSTQSAQTIFAWGAQLEAGAFATSYIPTTSGTAARSADVCSIIGGDFSSFYNQSEGTAVTKVTNALGIESNAQYPFSFSGASSANLLTSYRVLQSSLKIGRFASIVSGSDTLSDSANAGTLSDGVTDIIGFAIKLNNFAGSLDGNLITDNTVTLPTVDRMFIGSRFDGTRYWNGHIARIQYFRKRLPNAKLQTLTAP